MNHFVLNGIESQTCMQSAEIHGAQVISNLNQVHQPIRHCLILVALVLPSCLRGCGLALLLPGGLGPMPNTLMKPSSAGTNWMADFQLSPNSVHSDPSRS